MKKVTFFFCLLFFGIASQAQKHEPVNTITDLQEYRGYTIRLLQAASGTFGYDIFQGPERIVHQSGNPFTFSPRGLAKKDDAYKLAQWQITKLRGRQGAISTKILATETNRKLPTAVAQKLKGQRTDVTLLNQRLSPDVAKQLQITITH